ncbi:hypothetical protein TrST_g13927 [Triparma strigata]|uniref:Uncharacterized protein n=1 Tax=Triparma strigata TaxID=1606541 RepID=A0A9W7BGY5_9STRA|nr:hypothetical protein TrST_g13927 [Triparma strigata]
MPRLAPLVALLLALTPQPTSGSNRWLRHSPEKKSNEVSSTFPYTPEQASKFIGAQHWYESGIYADKGLASHYDGYFCLCSCDATPEGIFCGGSGVSPDGSKVADFLGVFSESRGEGWEGDLVAFNTDHPFADKFSFMEPGSAANYTGVSQSLGDGSFVWRGIMSGVDCASKDHCYDSCQQSSSFKTWYDNC